MDDRFGLHLGHSRTSGSEQIAGPLVRLRCNAYQLNGLGAPQSQPCAEPRGEHRW